MSEERYHSKLYLHKSINQSIKLDPVSLSVNFQLKAFTQAIVMLYKQEEIKPSHHCVWYASNNGLDH
jgi:hypothetical protein